MVRDGLRLILELGGVNVLADVGDGEEALAVVAEHRPDVVLMDLRMPRTDGIEATRRIVEAGLPSRVLALTTFDLDDLVYEALRAGAAGFLLKDVTAERPSIGCGGHGQGTVSGFGAGSRPDHRPLRRAASGSNSPRPAVSGQVERTRAGGAGARRRRALQHRDRRCPCHIGRHSEKPRSPHSRQARTARPRPGRRARSRSWDDVQ